MRVARVVIAIGLITACGKHSPVSPGLCSSPVQVHVSAGIRPLVTWSPACAVDGLMLIETGVAAKPPEWDVSAITSGIVPPVTYGSTPNGAQAFVLDDALAVGHHYTIYLERGRSRPSLVADSLAFTVQ